jgi:hypothetical protein
MAAATVVRGGTALMPGQTHAAGSRFHLRAGSYVWCGCGYAESYDLLMEPNAWEGFLCWIGQAQWGTVPAWFGGASLLLAFFLFMRDRRRDDRALIDKIAIWPTVTYDQTSTALVSAAKRNDGTRIKLTAKNASDLPVEVHAAVFEVTSQWMVPASPAGGGWSTRPGTEPAQLSLLAPVLLAPGDDKIISDYGMNLAHQAPGRAVQLDPLCGVTARVRWFLAIDNAGRRWEVRPGQGRRARRIRWYSRRRGCYPMDWQYPIIRPLKVQLYKGRDAVRAWKDR